MAKSSEYIPDLDQARVAEEILRRKQARTNLLDFVDYVWWNPHPFHVGIHTRIIADRITRAIADFRAGKSTFLCATVPFRHGKSDMISRALPPFFIGACSETEPDVICSGYGADLVKKFSRKAKMIVQSDEYKRLFGHVRLSRTKRTDAHWKVDYQKNNRWRESMGDVTVSGLGGALTGSGYHLGIIDDFCKNRKEAESETFRDATWESFANDFMTRRAPTSITVVTATSWHADDLIQRIRKKMAADPDFPSFEFMVFPAKGPGRVNGETLEYIAPDGRVKQYLFDEHFSADWYAEQYSTLGKYAAAALMDCAPTIAKGARFAVDQFDYVQNLEDFPKDVRYIRFWDLASTEKQTIKDDPDFTVGALVAVTYEQRDAMHVPHVWIKDVVFGQWSTTKRDEIIRTTAATDGAEVRIIVEAVGGYKDAVETLQRVLRGLRTVERAYVSKDKVVRAAPLEPICEAGHIHLLKAPWNSFLDKHFREFPWGAHDDAVDAISGAFGYLDRGKIEFRSGAFKGLGIF
jgi:predicted phage terminase large subunit-like protein